MSSNSAMSAIYLGTFALHPFFHLIFFFGSSSNSIKNTFYQVSIKQLKVVIKSVIYTFMYLFYVFHNNSLTYLYHLLGGFSK